MKKHRFLSFLQVALVFSVIFLQSCSTTPEESVAPNSELPFIQTFYPMEVEQSFDFINQTMRSLMI